jgi:hypothetical protein
LLESFTNFALKTVYSSLACSTPKLPRAFFDIITSLFKFTPKDIFSLFFKNNPALILDKILWLKIRFELFSDITISIFFDLFD